MGWILERGSSLCNLKDERVNIMYGYQSKRIVSYNADGLKCVNWKTKVSKRKV